MFIDYVKIHVIAGHGGSGCVSFHREKFVPKGGPDGGDGGHGGSVILVGNRNLRTLQDYSYHKLYKAKRGQHGMGDNRHGKKGQDVILQVPLGTVVKDAETGEILGDAQITTSGTEYRSRSDWKQRDEWTNYNVFSDVKITRVIEIKQIVISGLVEL